LTSLAHLNPMRFKGYYWDQSCQMYYLQSRFYDSEICRFISADDIDYLDSDNIGGLNLFAYCLNNPIMMFDSDGNMPRWVRTGLIVGAAVLAVAAIGAVTVLSGGTLLPVLVGAGIGAVIGGGVSAGFQYITTGTIDWHQVIVDAAIGGVLGAFGGSSISKIGMMGASGSLGFGSSIATDFVNGDAINWGSAMLSGILGVGLAFFGGAGAQHGQLGGVKTQLVLKARHHSNTHQRWIEKTRRNLIRERKLLQRNAIETILRSSAFTLTTSIISFRF